MRDISYTSHLFYYVLIVDIVVENITIFALQQKNIRKQSYKQHKITT